MKIEYYLYFLFLFFSSFTCSAGQFTVTGIHEDIFLTKIGESYPNTNAVLLPGQEQLSGQAFQQDALTSYNGYQYTVYYNGTRNVCIARRKLPLGQWQEIMLPHKNTADDSHNVISMGICKNDGTIHLSYDHHNTTLHYCRSVIGLADNPETIEWSASAFGPDINYLEEGVIVPDVTYPRFINKPDGNLLFECRYKLSGDGDSYLREYDGKSHQWISVGRYVQGMDYTPNACAYINRMDYDVNGRLHVSWCWRDDFGGGSNHDIFYGYSDDHGRTWKDDNGKQVAVTENIAPTDNRVPGACMRQGITSLKIANIGYNRGYINQESQVTDSKGRVHILNSYMPDGTGTDQNWNSSRKKAVLHHRYRDTDGLWKVNLIKNKGDNVHSYCRSQIVIDALDNAYVIANGAEIYAATSAANYSDWRLVSDIDKDRFCSEPQVDHVRILEEDVLSFVYLDRNHRVTVIDCQLGCPEISSGSTQEVINIIKKVNNYWQETHPDPGNAFWDNAAYHTGNIEAYKITGEKSYKAYSENWAEKNQWKGAVSEDKTKWKYKPYGESPEYVLFGDWQICFQTYIDLFMLDGRKDPHKIARATEVMEYQINTPVEDYWWWADGLYMVMPVMIKMYQVTGNSLYLEKLHQYFSYANSIMFDKGENLYYRDAKYVYPMHKTINGKKDFWARGDGWVFAALAKVISDLPKDSPYRQEYIDRFQSMAEAIVRAQQPEGHWSRSMLDPEHAPGYETSGTAFFTYGLFWGINNGYLEEEKFIGAASKGWNYLKNIALQHNGLVGYVQPIGERADQHKNVGPDTTTNFGTGAFLLAASELVRYLMP